MRIDDVQLRTAIADAEAWLEARAAGESLHFTTAGDLDGLLILVTPGRPWFPTDAMGAGTAGST
ncbi:hypothetical protein F6B41_01605 [Microbacterium lushaniae]|nr:hypothetical protein F6B41_24130 [Microbacterium lushaniae]KAA9159172.1 hypothetical protein F6B41_01605 [Microbacterium lushaniae]